ncbi:MAG: hypothetical protein PVI74_16425 [Syntrophobacterales bacterium]
MRLLSTWEIVLGVTPTSLASSVWDSPLLERSSLSRRARSTRPEAR